MSKYDVICIGLATVDVNLSTVGPEVFEEDSSYIDSVTTNVGGDATNQAMACASLGLKTGLMCLRGNDFYGEFLTQSVEKRGIKSMISVTENAPTTVSVVMIDKNQERHFALQEGTIAKFSKEHIQWEEISSARLVSIGSIFALESFDGEDAVEMLQYAKEHGVMTLADFSIGTVGIRISQEMICKILSSTDYIVPSLREAELMTGEKEIEKIIEKLCAMGAANIFLKLGEKGSYVHVNGVEGYVDALPAAVVDTTGAGDNYTAGVIYGLLHGLDPMKCAGLGAAAGAIAIESIGSCSGLKSEEQLLERAGMRK